METIILSPFQICNTPISSGLSRFWFRLGCRKFRGVTLSLDEMEPHRETQSKRFVPKVMFMCAVARPWYGSNGDLLFDGKIGIFPFIVQEPAQRSSKYRRRGEMVTKPLQSITKQHMRRMLIDNVLPAIKAKWPEGRSKAHSNSTRQC